MALPKLKVPIFETTIPSQEAGAAGAARIRQISTKEEKILLMAKEGGEAAEILAAVKQIVNNCLLEPKNAIDELALFDLEFLYLRIRAISMSSKMKLSFRDNDDHEVRDFTVDLNTIEVTFPEKDRRNVTVDGNVSIRLKYPPAALYDDKKFLELTGEKVVSELVVRCIERVYENGNVAYDHKTGKIDELITWVDDLPVEVYDQIKEFLLDLPTLKHTITYTNKNNDERKVVLSTLNDFFFLH